MKKILVCTCYDMSDKARIAYSTLFPKEEIPSIIKGKENIRKFGEEVGNDHVIAISKLTGRFAYFLEIEGGDIIKEYDLLTGKRIA